MLKKEPKIVFHHIPKCGGTSIVTGLVLTYYSFRFLKHRRKGFSSNLNSRAASVVAEQFDINRYDFRRQLLNYFVEKGDSSFIAGHYPFDQSLYNKHSDEWNFITLLRDPVERWYSEYFWNRYKDHSYQKIEVPIEEYLETDQGRINSRSYVNFLSHSDRHAMEPTQDEVNESIETLKKMKVIGCLEYMDRFQDDMKSAFGRRPFFWNRNKSPAHVEQRILPDKESDLHKKILELTSGDQEIYQAAKTIIGI